MPTHRHPFVNVLFLLGAGLCVWGAGYEDAGGMGEYPTILTPIAAAVVALFALVSLAGAGPSTDKLALLATLLLVGYTVNTVTLTLYFTHRFSHGVVPTTVGGVLLLVGAMLALFEPAAGPAAAVATATTATATTTMAPAGWYADPEGGSGQRYWDGAAWGQTHP